MAKASGRGMKAYVLIETSAGKTKNVKNALAKIRSASTVENLEAVTGPYDFIAVASGATLDVIGKRGNERPVDAGAHGLQPAQPRRTGIEVGRKLPRIQHVRVGDGRRGLRRRRARHHVQASAAR